MKTRNKKVKVSPLSMDETNALLEELNKLKERAIKIDSILDAKMISVLVSEKETNKSNIIKDKINTLLSEVNELNENIYTINSIIRPEILKELTLEEESIYVVKFKDIKCIIPEKENEFSSNHFNHKFILQEQPNYDNLLRYINSEYTLLKYIGNDTFIEFYTGNTIKIFDMFKEYNLDSFIQELEDNKDSYLAVSTGLNELKEYNDEYKIEVLKNKDCIDNINSFFHILIDDNKRKVKAGLNSIKDNDYEYAELENKLYDFKKIKTM